MKVLPILLLLFALPAPAAASGPASVRVVTCHSALDAADRSAVFQGDMRAVRGTSRMQMRFRLLARDAGSGRWGRVAGARLDTWVSSDAGKRRYVYDKRVDGLLAPAEYRVRVRFRWLDAGGRVVARARRISPVCSQRDLRPDLRLTGVERREGGYLVTVRNTGRSAAGPFGVALTVPGSEPRTQRADGLAAGARTALRVDAPACQPGSALQVWLDPDDEVDEASEPDGALSVPCPTRV